MGNLREYDYTCMISPSNLFRMRNVSDKVIEKIKTHILYLITLFFRVCAVYEIM
jgi:hypothetical protein